MPFKTPLKRFGGYITLPRLTFVCAFLAFLWLQAPWAVVAMGIAGVLVGLDTWTGTRVTTSAELVRLVESERVARITFQAEVDVLVRGVRVDVTKLANVAGVKTKG